MAETLDYQKPQRRRRAPPERARLLGWIGLAVGTSVPLMLAAVPIASRGTPRGTLLLLAVGCWIASIVLATITHTQGYPDNRSKVLSVGTILLAFLAPFLAFGLSQLLAPVFR